MNKGGTFMKSTKRALIGSILSMVLCAILLVGTTLAWFTSTLETSVNELHAGNLDEELYYSKTMAEGSWKRVETTTSDLFTNKDGADMLWEPGATNVCYFRIVNNGSLAMKYELSVKIDSEIGGTNVGGEAFNLSNYIDLGYVEPTTTYLNAQQAINAVTYGAGASSGTLAEKNGVILAAGDLDGAGGKVTEKLLALVLYMPDSVQNEANYVGETRPAVRLKIKLSATQLDKEVDSFSSDYDADIKVVNVGTAEDLKAAIEDFTAGTTVVLDQDIDLQNVAWDVSVPYAAAGSKVIFNGNGHTIRNLKATGDNCGLFGHFNSNGNIVIKDLKLDNVDLTGTNVDGESGGGALIGWSEVYGGTLTIENVTATNVNIKDFKYIGGLVGYTSAPNALNITNCSVNGGALDSTYNESGNYKGHVGGIIGLYTCGTMSGCSVSDLTITGSTTANRAGALIGTAQNGVVVGGGNSVHSTTINGTAVTAAPQVIGLDNRTDKTTNVTVN